jgi:hypothetical protein
MELMTFAEYVFEADLLNEGIGPKTAAAVGITVKIRSLHQQIMQDRTASKAEKTISQEILWLASMVAFEIVTSDRSK